MILSATNYSNIDLEYKLLTEWNNFTLNDLFNYRSDFLRYLILNWQNINFRNILLIHKVNYFLVILYLKQEKKTQINLFHNFKIKVMLYSLRF